MPQPPATPAARVARWPGAALGRRKASKDGINYAHQPSLKQMAREQLEIDSRVEGADSALLSSDGAGTSITAYEIDLTTGIARVGGKMTSLPALNDEEIVGAGQWAKSYALDGEAPAVLSADGKTYEAAIVAILAGDPLVVDHAIVVGAEAADGAEVAPTEQQIRDALEAATTRETSPLLLSDLAVFLVVGRIKIQREAVDTIAMTHTAAASDAALKIERARGVSLAATAA